MGSKRNSAYVGESNESDVASSWNDRSNVSHGGQERSI